MYSQTYLWQTLRNLSWTNTAHIFSCTVGCYLVHFNLLCMAVLSFLYTWPSTVECPPKIGFTVLSMKLVSTVFPRIKVLWLGRQCLLTTSAKTMVLGVLTCVLNDYFSVEISWGFRNKRTFIQVHLLHEEMNGQETFSLISIWVSFCHVAEFLLYLGQFQYQHLYQYIRIKFTVTGQWPMTCGQSSPRRCSHSLQSFVFVFFFVFFKLIIRRIKSFKSQVQTRFQHDKQHGFIRSVEMLYLLIFILTTDGTIDCVMSDTRCQMVWYQLLMQDHTPTECYNVLMQSVSLPAVYYPPCGMGHVQWAPGVVKGSI